MKLSCPLTIMQSKEQKVNQAINLLLSILYSVLLGMNISNLFVQLLKTTRMWCHGKQVKGMEQIRDAQGCQILAAKVQCLSSDSNYYPLKYLLYPIPGFLSLQQHTLC